MVNGRSARSLCSHPLHPPAPVFSCLLITPVSALFLSHSAPLCLLLCSAALRSHANLRNAPGKTAAEGPITGVVVFKPRSYTQFSSLTLPDPSCVLWRITIPVSIYRMFRCYLSLFRCFHFFCAFLEQKHIFVVTSFSILDDRERTRITYKRTFFYGTTTSLHYASH